MNQQTEGRSIPIVASGISAAVLDDEVVIYRFADGMVHRLDPLGSLVWQCLDGSTSIDDLVADLADEFHSDPAVVRDDVTSLVDKLHDAGALVIPGASTASGEPPAWATPDAAPRVLPNPPSP